MAALQGDAVLHLDDQNNVVSWIYRRRTLPLASITEHQSSDEEFYSGSSESSS